MRNLKFISLLSFVFCLGFVSKSNAQIAHGQIVYLQSASNESVYLSPRNGAVNVGALVAVHELNASTKAACSWKLEKAGGDYFYLRNVKTGLYLDVQGGAAKSWSPMIQNGKSAKDSQKFQFVPSHREGLHYLHSKLGSGLCLDLKSTLPVSGTEAAIFIKGGGRGVQNWKVIPVNEDDPSYSIVLESIKCINVADPGNEIELFGTIRCRQINNGGIKGPEVTLFNLPKDKLVDMKKGDVLEINVSKKMPWSDLSVEDVLSRKVTFQLVNELYEHDSTSQNDKFDPLSFQWEGDDVFNKTKVSTLTEIEGNDALGKTVLEIRWRVEVD
ncbi:MAG: RICIN domain-containing protein [Saprospiraceae bacterium]|nr:RICIN domain-containing protein [Saprospiraceae bacterium]